MSKIAHYLQEHLVGEVMTSADARRYFATDASVFTLVPSIIIYPRNENDVRKTARFTWQLAERGRIIPITARGAGTDQSGAAIGNGVVMCFTAHMNKILELDPKTGNVSIEPGIVYGKLQQTLHTHGRFLPPFPASLEYSTVGGAISNNAGGEKTVKYGTTLNYVESLRVVLANGEVIETGRLNKRDLNKKLGLNSFEGEIYRSLDALIEENLELVKTMKFGVSKNAAGYNLADIKQKDGSFDLTPLFVGSQGTLGIVSEAIMRTEPHNPSTTLIVASCDDVARAQEAIIELRQLPDIPSAIELIDDNLLNYVDKTNPNQLKTLVEKPFKKIMLFIEFDNINQRVQKRMVKKTQKILEKFNITFQAESDIDKQQELWKIRHAAATVTAHADGNARSLPLIEDGIVPIERFSDYLNAVYGLFERYELQASVWGHGGDANLHMQPFLDLNKLGDRQKIFKMLDEYYDLVISMGGSTTGEHNDGRLRGPYLRKLYGDEIYALFQRVKQIFDPFGTLNPGVKIDVNLDDLKALMRNEYSLNHMYANLPRS